MEKYKKQSPDARPYRPLFMVLTGRFVEAPRDGFGADYPGAFLATQAVAIRPQGRCLNE
jgi:hypothetical protein